MGGGDRLVAHVRVVGDEPGGEGLETGEPVGRQPELGDQHPFLVEGSDLGF